MKKLILLSIPVILFNAIQAQSVAINNDGSVAHPSAILDVKSLTKGVLFPRMTSAERNAIAATQGLLVFDTETNSFWFNTGSEWKNLGAGGVSGGWSITDTSAELNFGSNGPHARISALNTSYGYATGNKDLTDQNTIVIGKSSREGATGGFNNIAIGDFSMTGATGDSNNIAIGKFASSSIQGGKENVAIGSFAVSSVVNSSYNVGIGSHSLGELREGGHQNVSIGFSSTRHMNKGSGNVAVGFESMRYTTEAIANTALGTNALSNNSTHLAFANTAIGNESMYTNSGRLNTGLGYRSMYNAGGTANVAIGAEALYTSVSDDPSDPKFGNNNTAVGYHALYENTKGSNNTAIGVEANMSVANLENATAIGANAIVNASNKVRIGNSDVTVIEGQVPFTVPSDGRYKFNIKEDVPGLSFILKLHPVTYQFDINKFNTNLTATSVRQVNFSHVNQEAIEMRRTGFIAQEVEKAAVKTGYDFSGLVKPKTSKDHYSLSYEAFVVPLVKAVQEQQEMIRVLIEEIQTLKSQIAEMRNK